MNRTRRRFGAGVLTLCLAWGAFAFVAFYVAGFAVGGLISRPTGVMQAIPGSGLVAPAASTTTPEPAYCLTRLPHSQVRTTTLPNSSIPVVEARARVRFVDVCAHTSTLTAWSRWRVVRYL